MLFREHRCPCDIPIQVKLQNGQSSAGIVVNVSSWGARLAKLPRLTVAERLHITLSLGLELPEAEVRWANEVYCGVRFQRQLDQRAMAVIRQSVAHKTTTNPKGWNLQLREMR